MRKKFATLSLVTGVLLAVVLPGAALAEMDDRLDREMRQPIVPIQVTQTIVLSPVVLNGMVIAAPFGVANAILVLAPNGQNQTVLVTPQTLFATPTFTVQGVPFILSPGDLVTIIGGLLKDGRILAQEIRIRL